MNMPCGFADCSAGYGPMIFAGLVVAVIVWWILATDGGLKK